MEETQFEQEFSIEQINTVCEQFWVTARTVHVITFSGDLGAGKTTFIRTLCEFLGVSDPVSSPTFALVNEYGLPLANGQSTTIYHLDWYRLRDSAEAFGAGMEEYIDAGLTGRAYCFIEWPEKAADLLPVPRLKVHIQQQENGNRILSAVIVR